MKEPADPPLEEEAVRAKRALADGKPKRAVYHLAAALEGDPGRRECLALQDAAAREEVTGQFVEMMRTMPQQGHVPYAHALVCCFQQFPTLSEKERATLREWRRELEGSG